MVACEKIEISKLFKFRAKFRQSEKMEMLDLHHQHHCAKILQVYNRWFLEKSWVTVYSVIIRDNLKLHCGGLKQFLGISLLFLQLGLPTLLFTDSLFCWFVMEDLYLWSKIRKKLETSSVFQVRDLVSIAAGSSSSYSSEEARLGCRALNIGSLFSSSHSILSLLSSF